MVTRLRPNRCSHSGPLRYEIVAISRASCEQRHPAATRSVAYKRGPVGGQLLGMRRTFMPTNGNWPS